MTMFQDVAFVSHQWNSKFIIYHGIDILNLLFIYDF